MSANYITIENLANDPQIPDDLRSLADGYDISLRVPIRPTLEADILAVIESGRGKLDMSDWHTCKTVHCLAGWAVELTGKYGATLERELNSEDAGALIFYASTGSVPNFFDDDDEALFNLRTRVAKSKGVR